MAEFFKNHKKQFIIAAIISVVIFAIYLFLLFQPGFWYRGVFLYKQKAPFEGMEVYSGKDTLNNARYEMTMAKDGIKTHIAFTVNETERYYEIISDNSEDYYPDVEIYENDELVFKGTHRGFGLLTEDDEFFEEPIEIIPSYAYPLPEEELFPSYNWFYDISQSVKPEIRGNPLMLIGIVVLATVAALDIIYPDMFWELEHWLDTKGGEPSEFYRFSQKALHIVSLILIVILMILSFSKNFW